MKPYRPFHLPLWRRTFAAIPNERPALNPTCIPMRCGVFLC